MQIISCFLCSLDQIVLDPEPGQKSQDVGAGAGAEKIRCPEVDPEPEI